MLCQCSPASQPASQPDSQHAKLGNVRWRRSSPSLLVNPTSTLHHGQLFQLFHPTISAPARALQLAVLGPAAEPTMILSTFSPVVASCEETHVSRGYEAAIDRSRFPFSSTLRKVQ